MSNPQHNDGGPAFPHSEFVIDVALEDGRRAARVYDANPGMSLRDYFAGQCDPAIYNPLDTLTHKLARKPTVLELVAFIAELRLIEADAMLRAREDHT